MEEKGLTRLYNNSVNKYTLKIPEQLREKQCSSMKHLSINFRTVLETTVVGV